MFPKVIFQTTNLEYNKNFATGFGQDPVEVTYTQYRWLFWLYNTKKVKYSPKFNY